MNDLIKKDQLSLHSGCKRTGGSAEEYLLVGSTSKFVERLRAKKKDKRKIFLFVSFYLFFLNRLPRHFPVSW